MRAERLDAGDGLAEAALSAAMRARLPQDAPGPPWRCRFEAVVWWRRADGRARAALDAVPGGAGRRGVGAGAAVTVGGFLTYLDTPVGPYREVLGAVVVPGRWRPRARVLLMAVDSAASVAAGRANWALPKTFARFDGAHDASRAPSEAAGDGWRVAAAVRWRGPGLPAPFGGVLQQPGADGRLWASSVAGGARVRPARITVAVTASPAITPWFPAGWCWGAVLESGTLTLDAAQSVGPVSR